MKNVSCDVTENMISFCLLKKMKNENVKNPTEIWVL